MDSAERADLVVARLKDRGEVGVVELAEATGHSEMTIRRDLDRLAAQGVLRRVRGGAVSLVPRGQEPPFGLRERQAADAKRRIAAEVGEMIPAGSAVVLDSGTTAVEVARVLNGRPVTVMPLSLQAAQALEPSADTRVLMPGGEVRAGELNLHGPLAEAALAAVRFDVAVLGCCGLSVADGFTAHDLADVAVKRAAMRSARRTIAATDSTKIGHVAMGHVCPVGDLDALVTDAGADEGAVAEIRAAGVAVVTV
ncbi:DeoR/GlpR family DNA-binding transcription regulator [Nocardiopsis composta]|uniref:DeoR/GlpR family transcriptional regulator of sugar metabolism n=1 Tax=Nocardiopsis composta TaxID=157465 RepID=A0A7W8QJI8_9ACTN|nr:DeoR/GlpR family DNA-binding transcription regulator [Nocardiopsis composta]MBB5431638.1 DeoR/GlpR family transcriptional regulator of sugar metabolism [Nocardiopsis composta]